MSLNLTIGSLFSGIGGLELGLERAGVGRTVWQVEQNEYCRAVLAKHWPDATRHNDVCGVGAHNLRRVDVICGGFPCQDISYAGKGAGLAGERSGLWYEYARIVRELGPRYVVVENVAALLTRGLGDVLGTLADLGYDAEWSRISAADVGAHHLRERIFIVAHPPHGEQQELPGQHHRGEVPRPFGRFGPRVGASGGSITRDTATRSEGTSGVAEAVALVLPDPDSLGLQGLFAECDDANNGCIARERQTGLRGRAGEHRTWPPEPAVGRVAHGIPERVDRIKALGNAVVPQVAEVVGHVIVRLETERRNAERVA